MRYLIKADFKKTFNLKKNRNYVIILGVVLCQENGQFKCRVLN